MLKFDGGVGSSRYSSPGVLGFFFGRGGIGRFVWLSCVSEAKYRFSGLNFVKFCLNDINSKRAEVGDVGGGKYENKKE